jgi:hypothetical protein
MKDDNEILLTPHHLTEFGHSSLVSAGIEKKRSSSSNGLALCAVKFMAAAVLELFCIFFAIHSDVDETSKNMDQEVTKENI